MANDIAGTSPHTLTVAAAARGARQGAFGPSGRPEQRARRKGGGRRAAPPCEMLYRLRSSKRSHLQVYVQHAIGLPQRPVIQTSLASDKFR